MSNQQDKMSNFIKRKANEQQQPIPKPDEQSESKVYQFSEIEEYPQDDDIAIVNFIQKASTQQPPKRPQQRVPSAQKRQAPAKKPYQFNKLNESEKEKIFLDVYDENLKLKEKQGQLEKYYSNLEVRFNQMDKFVHNKGNAGAKTQEVRKITKDEESNYQMSQLENENMKLKQKLMAMTQASKVVVQQPKQKKLVSVDKPEGDAKSYAVPDTQIKELLKLNDMLKKRCLEQESQFRALQAMMNSKLVNHQDLSSKNAQLVTLKERYDKLEQHMGVMRNQVDDERKRQSEIMQLLREEKEKNHVLESQIRSMELGAKSVVDLQTDLSEARRQKQDMQERLAILMESPFFKEYNERANIQAKLRTMENESARTQNELKNLRESNAKLETENRIRKEELESARQEIRTLLETNKEYSIKLTEKEQQLLPFKDLQYWDNDQFLKVLGNLKWTGEDPAWRKIEFIDRTYMDSDDPNMLRKEIEHLKLEKGELAAHLEKTQTLLKTHQDIQIEKDHVHKSEIEKLQLQLKGALSKCEEYAKIADLRTQSKQQKTLYEAEGIKYDDSVSVFSADDEQVETGENFFDLWIGKGELQASGLLSSYQNASSQALDIHSLLTFLTVDFYDHETQHTGVSEGTSCNFNLQISFKVEVNGAFINFLEGNYLKVEIYVSQGSEATRVGTGLLQLKELVYQNQQDTVSKVIGGQISVYGLNNQFVGIVEYKARMRYPISQVIRWLRDQKELQLQEEDDMDDIVAVRKRKLVIAIDRAHNLPGRSSTFVYYSFDSKDFNTNTQSGANPKWEYRMVHEVVYNEQFQNQFKRMPIDFYLIDDNMPLTEGAADKLGITSVDITPLLNNDMIDVAAEIKNDEGDRVGSIFIKIFWYDLKEEEGLSQKGLITQNWEDNLTAKINSEMRSRGLVGITAFRVFDKDNDQMISFDDFSNGIRNVLNIKLNPQELQLYYQKLPQPLNQQYFESAFKLQSLESMYQSRLPQSEYGGGGTQDISKINQIINYNSQQLQDPQEQLKEQIADIFRRKIKAGKTKQDIFREIDSTKPDGIITVEELQGWLSFQKLTVPIPQLRQFIQLYMDINRDQQIDLKEFYNFFLNDMQDTKQSDMGKGDKVVRQDPVQIAIQTILQYANSKQWTLMKVREVIDDNRNSFIEKAELRGFLEQFGVLRRMQNEAEINQIMDYFDQNKDGRISIQEFSDALSEENRRARIIQKQASFESIQNYIVGYFIAYMNKKSKSLQQLFNDIDQDQNGYLIKQELKNMFKYNIAVPIDTEEIDLLYKEFDADKDGKISIKEFISMMKPSLEAAQRNQTLSNQNQPNVESLMRKSEEICNKYYNLLLKSFQQSADKVQKHLIPADKFQSVLLDLGIGYNSHEVDHLVNFICIKEKGMINYQAFIDLGKKRGYIEQSDVFGQTSNSGFGAMSQIDQEKAVSKAKEVFARISRALRRTPNSDAKQLFKAFDIDNDGRLTKVEMGKVFGDMKLRVSSADLDLIFKALDRNDNAYISIDEFLKYIDL